MLIFFNVPCAGPIRIFFHMIPTNNILFQAQVIMWTHIYYETYIGVGLANYTNIGIGLALALELPRRHQFQVLRLGPMNSTHLII